MSTINLALSQTEAIALVAILRGHDVNLDLTNVCQRIEDAYSAPSATSMYPHIVMQTADGKTADPSVDIVLDHPVRVREYPSVDQDKKYDVRASLLAIVERLRTGKMLTEADVDTVHDLLRHTGWHSFTCHECGQQTDDCVTVRRHKHGDCDETYTGPPIEELLAKVAAIFGLDVALSADERETGGSSPFVRS